MAKLAIKGHPTRGKEVIEILEMLGGINTYKINYTEKNLLYCLREGDNVIIATYPNSSLTNVFTLEEFLEKFPYKAWDKVSSKYLKNYEIEKMEWDDTNNRVIYKLRGMGWYSADELQPYKEEAMEEEGILTIDFTKDARIADEVEVILGDYEFVLKDGKTYFVKKKPKYPKTYEECCKVLLLNPERATCGIGGLEYKRHLIVSFQRLLICRDAYWKISEDWKPEYKTLVNNEYFTIHTFNGEIVKSKTSHRQSILAFPTEEMRDAFYENFKELIEICKEYL